VPFCIAFGRVSGQDAVQVVAVAQGGAMGEVGGATGAQERSSRLQAGVADYVAKTKGRVAFQGDDRAVVITGRPVNHILHLLLTIVTAGLWIFVWIIAVATGGEESHILTVDDTGAVMIQGDKTVTTGNWRLPRIGGLALIIIALLLYPLGVTGAPLLLGLLVLGGGGLALMVTDIRKYGTGRTVAAVERL
jgi:hypothetical protein